MIRLRVCLVRPRLWHSSYARAWSGLYPSWAPDSSSVPCCLCCLLNALFVNRYGMDRESRRSFLVANDPNNSQQNDTTNNDDTNKPKRRLTRSISKQLDTKFVAFFRGEKNVNILHVDNYSRVLFPATFLIFNILYWGYYYRAEWTSKLIEHILPCKTKLELSWYNRDKNVSSYEQICKTVARVSKNWLLCRELLRSCQYLLSKIVYC